MHALLWTLQGFLAFLYVVGGAYKTFMFGELASQIPALPPGAWRALGVIEIACGLLLVAPAIVKGMPAMAPLAAAVLTVETLALAGLYARYSLVVTAANPLVWAATMGLLVGCVAYGRYALRPLA